MNIYDNSRNIQTAKTINSVVVEESLERQNSNSTGGHDTANISPELSPYEI